MDSHRKKVITLEPATELETPVDAKTRRAKLRDFVPYLGGHHLALLSAIVASLAATGLAIVQPIVVKNLIGGTTVEQGAPVILIWILVAITIGEALFSAARSYLLQRTGEAAVLGLRRSLIGRLLRLPITEYDQRALGDLLSRAGTDSAMVRSLVTSGIFDLGAAAIMFVASLLLMVSLDSTLLLLVLATVTVGTVSVLAMARLIRVASLDVQNRVGDMSASVLRSLSAIRTIRAAGATADESERVIISATAAYGAGVNVAKLEAFIRPIISLFIQGSIVVVLAIGGVRVASGTLELASLVAFVLYLSLLIQPISQGLGAVSQMQVALAALQRVNDIVFLDEEDAGDAAISRNLPLRVPTAQSEALIEFRSVRFAYASGTQALQDVSFSIIKGTRNAIVGPSGAGKSTILALAERFYEIDSGAILYSGNDIRSMPRASVRSNLGYVEQEATSVSGTIADNLRLGNPNLSDLELMGALDAVGLDDVVHRSSEGLQSRVGDDGVMLSGGQRQRLAWARVLLGNAELLLLDEPTSSVDAVTEEILQNLLASQTPSRTVLVVAHRLSTVVNSDQIIVVEDGRTTASGTHDELLLSSEIYRELAVRQLVA
ncbi:MULTISPECIES: ABC transporter ATP-binding protein [Cryobacterium]|uniref:ABC transporter ATP-binding protein n=1 Tax=Cryobacterium breve TaxID=1259258 RepID=A0ABY2IXB8_9MICO|nr:MULTISPECIES: ABC transporter ATP-binding protein [Cryobacterium]TFC94435.1 ABC transporter ATP-binding protein [Cryobacterium sp. TmT3-12]TFC95039.1 ABC transporter ATP-binding protein [Cryobacterium breve]